MQFCQIFLLCLLLGVSAADSSEQWNTFKREHNKQYSSPIEESERKEIFLKNVDRMNAYVSSHPNANFTMKINSLFDRRAEELALKPKVLSAARNSLPSESVVDTRDLPASLDWRSKGAITPVRNQGLSGEIVAGIVSTELVESLQAISTGALVEGSFNRVFDCCPQPIDQFQCIKKMGGICRQTDYPTALGKCEPNKCTPFTNIGTIKVLPPGLESYMLTWIQNSTLWAELDATSINFLSYTGGVYDDDTTCSRTQMDHVVQIVGYGIEQGTPYWLCKNSWGANWGDQGYIRIARWKNMCGIATNVVLVADPIVSHAARLNILYGSFLALFLTRYLL